MTRDNGTARCRGQYELIECRRWEDSPQNGTVPFEFDGVIPSSPNISFLDRIQKAVIVLIIDVEENIRQGEVAILPPAE